MKSNVTTLPLRRKPGPKPCLAAVRDDYSIAARVHLDASVALAIYSSRSVLRHVKEHRAALAPIYHALDALPPAARTQALHALAQGAHVLDLMMSEEAVLLRRQLDLAKAQGEALKEWRQAENASELRATTTTKRAA